MFTGLPAHSADVRLNDVIIELEGIDVRRASGKQIVNIIRCSRQYTIVHYSKTLGGVPLH